MRSSYVLLFCAFAAGCGTAVPGSPSREAPDQAWPAAKSAPLPTGAPAAAVADGDSAPNSESYDQSAESPIVAVKDQPRSTFSIDADTASYSNIRRYLQQRQLPPPAAVRIEECLNYFTYHYPEPDGTAPVAVYAEVAGCPWNPAHRLARIGVQGRRVQDQKRPGANLVFLLDVSGSMNHPKKLPLVKRSMQMLVEQLGESDHIAIVVYAGAAGLVLPSTSATRKTQILAAIDQLQANGSTNGALGIRLAYEIATENFIKEGINRVVLCTDGDFNVGITNRDDLTSLIESNAKTGVFLTCLGYGMGNLKDATMERLADRGNGNYAYIDTIAEAKKVLVDQLTGTLVTIAKDVKIQVEFNPQTVAGYRLIGYDNRRLADRDFNNDAKDAGEIGSGHSVTALYEIVPAGSALASHRTSGTDPLKYQPGVVTASDSVPAPSNPDDELFTIALRYKQPMDETSDKIELPVTDRGTSFSRSTEDFRFAASVALFAMLLKDSPYCGDATFDLILELSDSLRDADTDGYRTEFFNLVRIARELPNSRL